MTGKVTEMVAVGETGRMAKTVVWTVAWRVARGMMGRVGGE